MQKKAKVKKNSKDNEIIEFSKPHAKIAIKSKGIVEVVENIDQRVIAISEDRLRVKIEQYHNAMIDSNAWQTPLGIFISMVLTICTTGFFNAWEEKIFLVFFGGTAVWMLYSLIQFCKSRKNSVTPNEFIKSCKRNEYHDGE